MDFNSDKRSIIEGDVLHNYLAPTVEIAPDTRISVLPGILSEDCDGVARGDPGLLCDSQSFDADRKKESPIQQLPLDTLARVFGILRLDTHQYDPHNWENDLPIIVISHVCRSWRAISLNSRRLWNSIKIGEYTSREIFQLYIERSGDTLLHVSKMDAEDRIEALDGFFEKTFPQISERLEFLDMNVNNIDNLSALPALFLHHLTQIRCLVISHNSIEGPPAIEIPLHRASTLECLSILGPTVWPIANLHRLTHIELCSPNSVQTTSPLTFFETMRLNQGLKVLVLEGWSFDGPLDPQVAPVPSLRHLWMKNCAPRATSFIVSSLVFSDTISIRLCSSGSSLDPSTVEDLIPLDFIEHLTISRLGLFSYAKAAKLHTHLELASPSITLAMSFSYPISVMMAHLRPKIEHLVSLPSLLRIRELAVGLTCGYLFSQRFERWLRSLSSLTKLVVIPDVTIRTHSIPKELSGLLMEDDSEVVSCPQLSEVKIFVHRANSLSGRRLPSPIWWARLLQAVGARERRGYSLSKISVDHRLKPSGGILTAHPISASLDYFDSDTETLDSLSGAFRGNFYEVSWEERWKHIPHPFF